MVKVNAKLKLSKRRKSDLSSGRFALSGNFMLSSVFEYKGYYGANLIIPAKDKKGVTFSEMDKKKKAEKVQAADDEDQ